MVELVRLPTAVKADAGKCVSRADKTGDGESRFWEVLGIDKGKIKWQYDWYQNLNSLAKRV